MNNIIEAFKEIQKKDIDRSKKRYLLKLITLGKYISEYMEQNNIVPKYEFKEKIGRDKLPINNALDEETCKTLANSFGSSGTRVLRLYSIFKARNSFLEKKNEGNKGFVHYLYDENDSCGDNRTEEVFFELSKWDYESLISLYGFRDYGANSMMVFNNSSNEQIIKSIKFHSAFKYGPRDFSIKKLKFVEASKENSLKDENECLEEDYEILKAKNKMQIELIKSIESKYEALKEKCEAMENVIKTLERKIDIMVENQTSKDNEPVNYVTDEFDNDVRDFTERMT